MLRKIRIVAAVLFFLLITLLFLDFTGTLHAWFGWMSKIQFLPALLAVNVGVVLALVALTLLFGRVYCSVICPLGVMQDIVSWFAGRRKKHRYRFSYSPALTWLRWTSRRRFFGVLGLFAYTALRAQEKKVDGGLAVIEEKKIPDRAVPILPPGAQNLRRFTTHCTSCQLCVSACPNQVLRPSGRLSMLMKPEMSYERGYCRPECARCAEVCPTDAIRLADFAEKSATQIGHAVWIAENCVVNTDGVHCNNCSRHCPAGAIKMVPRDPGDPQSPRIPAVLEERCIGCGACENLCPARPFSAIYVEGHQRQRII